MSEELTISQGTKEEKYAALYPQIRAVVEDETDLIANMANVAAMLHETFNFWWTGFYRVASDNELVLGPFQGPLACTRIKRGRGVCGTAWAEARTQLVPDVDQFPGHIACSSASRSEIVVPVMGKVVEGADPTTAEENKIVAVLDIDSERLANFDETDRIWLERIVDLL